MRENRTHGSEGGDGESRFRPLSDESLTGPPIKTFGGDAFGINSHRYVLIPRQLAAG